MKTIGLRIFGYDKKQHTQMYPSSLLSWLAAFVVAY